MIINESNNYSIKYVIVDKNDHMVTKRKDFKTEKDRDKFVDKISEDPNFIRIDAWGD